MIQYFDEYDNNDFIVFLLTIIYYCLYNISIMLTCDYFTPIHILIIYIIEEISYSLAYDSNSSLIYLIIFILILIFIMLLVFFEIIEINICKLSYNTKRNIESRSRKDTSVELEAIYLTDDGPGLGGERESIIASSNYIINT